MSRSTRRVTAFAITAALIGAGLAVSSPAVAIAPAPSLPPGVVLTNAGTFLAPDYTIEVDCSVIPGDGSYDPFTQFSYADLPIPLGTTVTVQTAGCTHAALTMVVFEEPRATATYTPVGGALDGEPQVEGVEWTNGDVVPLDTAEFELGPNTAFTVLEGTAAAGAFTIYTPLAVTVADPHGDVIDDITMLIPDDATADLVVTDDAQYYYGDGDLALGGIEGCGITEGNHFYAEAEIVIDKRGIYTFRLADLNPISNDLDFQAAELYLEDPFLALYSTFTPADGHQGVVGCNDDADLDEFSDYNITSSGTMMSDRYSQFTVELEPGTYTLVLTSYDDESEFVTVTAPASSAVERTEEPKGGFSSGALGVDETATIEVWSTAVATPELAATGPSPASGGMLAAGLALVALGGFAFASRRVWSRA